MKDEHEERRWRDFATSIRSTGHGRDYGELDPDMAFGAAMEAVANAADHVAGVLQRHTQKNAVREVKTVEGVAPHVHVAKAVQADESREALSGRVVGRAKIHIPRIKQGKLVLMIDDEGGNLSVELSFIE